MTPARIAEIADTVRISFEGNGFELDYDKTDASIRRAIRLAVNEFAEEAATKIDEKCASYAKDFAIPDAYECIEIVRALKLPEEA